MELNKTKVRYILRQYRKQVSTKEIALDIQSSLNAEFNKSSSNKKKQGVSRY